MIIPSIAKSHKESLPTRVESAATGSPEGPFAVRGGPFATLAPVSQLTRDTGSTGRNNGSNL